MDNLARDLNADAVCLARGLVRQSLDGWLAVETPSGIQRARRALGCLVKPEPGDVVLVATVAEGRCHVLAVLERPGQSPAELDLPGDVRLSAPRGGVTVAARDGVEVISGRSLGLTAPLVEMRGEAVEVAADRLGLCGRFVEARFERIKYLAAAVDAVIHHLTESIRNAFRRVEGLDLVRAAHIARDADDLYAVRGRYATMSADKDVKVDAEHIHLG